MVRKRKGTMGACHDETGVEVSCWSARVTSHQHRCKSANNSGSTTPRAHALAWNPRRKIALRKIALTSAAQFVGRRSFSRADSSWVYRYEWRRGKASGEGTRSPTMGSVTVRRVLPSAVAADDLGMVGAELQLAARTISCVG